jgi:hypothetical protein
MNLGKDIKISKGNNNYKWSASLACTSAKIAFYIKGA